MTTPTINDWRCGPAHVTSLPQVLVPCVRDGDHNSFPIMEFKELQSNSRHVEWCARFKSTNLSERNLWLRKAFWSVNP